MRVAYQAGAVRALFEDGITFHHGDGTSGGVINLGMLLSGLSPSEMCDRWRTLDPRYFISLMPWQEYLRADGLLAMGDADGLVRHVFPHLGIDVARIQAARGLDGTFNVCNFTDKTTEVIPHDRLELDDLVAGVSLPIFLPPVAKRGRLYTDAVWIRDANLMEAVRRGSDELWVIWCVGNSPEYKTGAFHQYVHMIEMSANGSLFQEFERIEEINERIRAGEVVWGHDRPIRLHVIRPEHPLPLDPDYIVGDIDAATLIDRGYADARKYLKQRTEEGVPFSPEATKMTETALGFTFRETMAGAFVLGETDPAAGEGRGELERSTFALHSTITIDDLDRFIVDPQHGASLAGLVDFTPFGASIPISKGTFNLFSPTANPKIKHMTYEVGFRHDGRDYFAAGNKIIEDKPGADLWKDTTRLFTRLHEGTDSTGPVVGAGVLTLGVGEVIRLVSTMRAVNPRTVADQATAVVRFGELFLGNLWDTYSKHLLSG